ncbi:MAG TPA: hypothetical protein VOA88_12315 [Candidatus Dormibacteraeota bacterium]|nr:hypothetical protein [Candidatus Dormibacteraeota bacterium]
MTTALKITDIVRNNNPGHFSFYRAGHVYYTVEVDGQKYVFPIALDDVGNASLFATMKAITLMRWIRKSIADGTFVKNKGG